MITNIKIDKISPHPDNPRKDLGDLSELAESIKVNGIFQNLTVVSQLAMRPGFCTSCNLYNGAVGKCKSDYDKSERPPCSKWEVRDDFVFTAVIGHRRLAAAKLAGLTEVPCVISDMDYKKQLSTMLLENMQRNDLTLWEQAQGFQMMLNFGEPVDAISAQTGFSESTIRRRVKLLDLDKDKFQKSIERGATLQDYAELDKIKDSKTKNSVLEKIGTPNFQWELRNAIDKETAAENKALLIAELEKFATQVKTSDGLQSVRWFSNFSNEIHNLKPVDFGNREYFFTVSPYNIQLLVKGTGMVETEAETKIKEEQQQLRERHERLDEISKIAVQLRHDFIRDYKGAKKHTREIMAFAVQAIMQGGFDYSGEGLFLKMLGVEPAEDDEDDEELTFDTVSGVFDSSPERVLLTAAYCSTANVYEKYYDWRCRFSKSEELDLLYSFLEKIGYEISEEESQLRDGTHELYVRGDKSPDEAD